MGIFDKFKKKAPEPIAPTDLRTLFKSARRNSIVLTLGGEALGRSQYGGEPLLPRGFDWPTFKTSTYYDDDEKLRPLHFLAQIDCAEAKKYDSDSLLPDRGILSFFYECDSNRWGFDPADAGSARVFWFEDADPLVATPRPDEEEPERFAPLAISFSREDSYPDGEDFGNICAELDWDEYDSLREELYPYPNCRHKLLGWSDNVQGSMPIECELISRGHYLGGGWPKLPDRERLARESLDTWLLLFQLDVVDNADAQLMLGDCGRLYYYIRREDLAARRFDRVWTIMQCG